MNTDRGLQRTAAAVKVIGRIAAVLILAAAAYHFYQTREVAPALFTVGAAIVLDVITNGIAWVIRGFTSAP